MEKKSLIIAFIFLGIIFLINFITATTIDISPNPINVGNTINININPDSYGIGNYLYIYTPYNQYIASIKLCTLNICYNPVIVNYTIPTTFFNGTYYFSLYSYAPASNGSGNSSNIINTYFNVEGSSVPVFETEFNLMPSIVASGNTMTIVVNPGSQGIRRYAYIYNNQNQYFQSIDLGCTTGSYCYTPFNKSITISTSWLNGNYSVQIYDNLIGSYKSQKFEIYGSNARGLFASLNPVDVSPGDNLSVFISPGTSGISSNIYIYDFRGKSKQTINLNCIGGKCYQNTSFNFPIPLWINGSYYIQIYDYNINSYNKLYFNVINSPSVLVNSSFTLSPSSIQRNQTLTINTLPGTDGYNGYLYFYKGTSYVGYFYLGCSTCTTALTKNYIIPASWTTGDYNVQLYDYTSSKYIINPLIVY